MRDREPNRDRDQKKQREENRFRPPPDPSYFDLLEPDTEKSVWLRR
jgi:hypothetical protein